MLTEKIITLVDGIDEFGNVKVKKITRILKDGVLYGNEIIHRHVLSPGDDIETELPHVAAAATAVWTPELIQARTTEVIAAINKQKEMKKIAVDELQIEIDLEKAKKAELDALKNKLPK